MEPSQRGASITTKAAARGIEDLEVAVLAWL
jgi:hypothetical protein